MLETDWFLTLALLAVIIGGVGLFVGGVAAFYSFKSWRLQKKQHDSSVAATQITVEELRALRLAEEAGTLSHRTQLSRAGVLISTWAMAWNVIDADDPNNKRLLAAIPGLLKKNFLERPHGLSLTADGRAVLRANRETPRASEPIVWLLSGDPRWRG